MAEFRSPDGFWLSPRRWHRPSDAKINRFQRETLNLTQFPLASWFERRDPALGGRAAIEPASGGVAPLGFALLCRVVAEFSKSLLGLLAWAVSADRRFKGGTISGKVSA
jgi:hypothetical protein